MANLQIIKDIAERKSMSIRELAERVGIKENQIHVMCRTNSTKIDTLEKIAKVLEVPISEFFDDAPAISVSGNHNQVNGHGAHDNINSNDAAWAERVRALEALLAEKERLIKVYEKLVER